MSVKFVTFADDNVAINPDQVICVKAIGPNTTAVFLADDKEPIILSMLFVDVLNALEYTEEEEGEP